MLLMRLGWEVVACWRSEALSFLRALGTLLFGEGCLGGALAGKGDEGSGESSELMSILEGAIIIMLLLLLTRLVKRGLEWQGQQRLVMEPVPSTGASESSFTPSFRQRGTRMHVAVRVWLREVWGGGGESSDVMRVEESGHRTRAVLAGHILYVTEQRREDDGESRSGRQTQLPPNGRWRA